MLLDELKKKFHDITPDDSRGEEGLQSWWEGYASALANEHTIDEDVFEDFITYIKDWMNK